MQSDETVRPPRFHLSMSYGVGLGLEYFKSFPFNVLSIWLVCVRLTMMFGKPIPQGDPGTPLRFDSEGTNIAWSPDTAPPVAKEPSAGEIRIVCPLIDADYKVPFSAFEAAMPHHRGNLPQLLEHLTTLLPEKPLGMVEWEKGRVVLLLRVESNDDALNACELDCSE